MNVMIHQQAEREAELMQANREELVERIARAMREDGTAQPLKGLAPVPLFLASKAGSQRGRAIRVRDCPGEQGGPSRREPLPLRPLTVSARHCRVAPRQPGPGSFERAALPQSPPGTRPHPRQFGHGRSRSLLAERSC